MPHDYQPPIDPNAQPIPSCSPDVMEETTVRLPREESFWMQLQAAKRQLTRSTYASMIVREYITMLIEIERFSSEEPEPDYSIPAETKLPGFPSDLDRRA